MERRKVMDDIPHWVSTPLPEEDVKQLWRQDKPKSLPYPEESPL